MNPNVMKLNIILLMALIVFAISCLGVLISWLYEIEVKESILVTLIGSATTLLLVPSTAEWALYKLGGF